MAGPVLGSRLAEQLVPQRAWLSVIAPMPMQSLVVLLPSSHTDSS